MNIPATLEEAIAQIAGLTKERNALLQKHRRVCKACAMLEPEIIAANTKHTQPNLVEMTKAHMEKTSEEL
jgi:hypothetical protein